MSDWFKSLQSALPRWLRVIGRLAQRARYQRRTEDLRRQLAGIIESSNDAIIGKTLDGYITSWNLGAEKLFGYGAREAVGNRMLLIFPPGREAEEARILARIAAGESIENFETVRRQKDGTLIEVAVTISPIRDTSGRIIGASKVAHSIADRKRAEAALLETSARLQLLIDHAPAAIALFDRDMRYVVASRRWRSDYRLGDQPIEGRSQYEVLPDLPSRWKELYARCLAGELISIAQDEFRRADGTVRWLKWDARPWRTARQEIGGLVIFSEDITEQKRTQDDLRIAAAAFDSRDGMVIMDQDGIILRVNRAFCETSGLAAEYVTGKSATTLPISAEDPLIGRKIARAMQRKRFWQGGIWNRRGDGKPYFAWLTISGVADADGKMTHYVAVFADITKHKRADVAEPADP